MIVYLGRAGKSRKIEAIPRHRAQEAALQTWFMTIPGAHPFWKNYMLSLVHLRDIEGVPPAKKAFKDAQYEFIVIALNPEKNPVPNDTATWHYLLPLNVSVQLKGITDDQAKAICEKLAEDCAEGRLFVEPSGIQGAREMWSDRITKLEQQIKNHDQ